MRALRERIREERPNNPESIGSRGSLTGRLKVRRPRKPAREKLMKPVARFSSLKIK